MVVTGACVEDLTVLMETGGVTTAGASLPSRHSVKSSLGNDEQETTCAPGL